MKPIDTFQNRLEKALRIRNMKPVELHEKTSISESLLSKYLSGNAVARQRKISLIADTLNVNPIWLMGYDVPMEEIQSNATTSNIVTIPILGTVKAGYNWLAEENIVDYISIKEDLPNINEYYALRIVGDSMLPLLSDGDLVIVHDQDDVESGQTAVVLINGEEATVKKLIKTNDGIELHAMNPYYPVRKFTFEDMNNIPVKIIGRVKEAKIKGAFK